MQVCLPGLIERDSPRGTTEMRCPGCRAAVVADVHARRRGGGSVARCRLCGTHGVLRAEMAVTTSPVEGYLAAGADPMEVEPFLVLAGSPWEVHRKGGAFEFTPPFAILAAVAVSMQWNRERVFWTRTLPLIGGAVVLWFVVSGAGFLLGFPVVGAVLAACPGVGVFLLHRRMVRRRAAAEMSPSVQRFLQHFGLSAGGLVQVGLAVGGDLAEAARLVRDLRLAP